MSDSNKKTLLKNCKLAYDVANLIHEEPISEISKILKITKQRLNYWLSKLVTEGILERKCQGYYVLTETSKKIIEALKNEKTTNKNRKLIRLENARFICTIDSGVENLINEVKWSKKQQLKTVLIYHGKFEGHTARLFMGITPTLEIYAGQHFGYDPFKIQFEALLEVVRIIQNMKQKYRISTSEPEPSTKPEYAIPSPISEAVLTSMGASQVRIVYNRSKGRDADIELNNIHYAAKFVRLPDQISELYDELNKLRRELKDTRISSYSYPQFF